MQQSFIEEVVDDVWNNYKSFNNLLFILPSKRAGTFLKKALSKKANETILAPDIYSIEEFIEFVAGISYATNTQQVFELYEAYLQTGTFEKEPFDSFLNWSQTVLQDFNEIDRYLIDAHKLFSNLAAIQEVTHWSLSTEKTELMENYLTFWNHLEGIYSNFNANLLAKQIGHQGLVYKKANEKLANYVSNNNITHVFLGFNALNKAESAIIQKILDDTNSSIYWDIDPYFLEDNIHDAGLFVRQHKHSWSYYKNHELKGLSSYYLSTKNIEIIGVPKNVSQAKYVGQLLSKIKEVDENALKNTALILGDENLLNPLLNSIPSEITSVNITMGQKLEGTPLASFFNSFFLLHELKTKKGWFYKDFSNFFYHPYTNSLLRKAGMDTEKLSSAIKSRNWLYIDITDIKTFDSKNTPLIKLLFSEFDSNPKNFIERCSTLTIHLKEHFSEEQNPMALEQLYKFHGLFNQILALLSLHSYVTSLKSLKSLFKQLLSSETLDFKGDPLGGLQIMGMLESRNLDFETIILTSVNEGILPSGKSNNSFIPFDLKIAHGLPTYKEKDAVYTYHFYRLLQRAKNVYLIYNTEPDVLEGGEKSRLITQLLTDENRKDITEIIAAPTLNPISIEQETIIKTNSLINALTAYSKKGFSPSSLSNYIRNPIDFYKKNLLGIPDVEAVEETIAANTFGTIVHDSLEEIYTPYIGQELNKTLLIHAKTNISAIVKSNFKKTYLDGDISSGKNYLSYHVIIKYLNNFIDLEIEQLENHNVKIIALEKNLVVELQIPGIDHPVILKGKLDRIDEVDGVKRIIDYKTGKVERRNIEITDWESIIDDYQYSKAFQLLCYSYMYTRLNPNKSILAGIISIKSLQQGTLIFAKKESARGAKKTSIDETTLAEFEQLLYKLILEIFNRKIPFLEKEV